MFATSSLNIHNTSANLAATQRMTNYKEDYLTISYLLIELTKSPLKLSYLSSPNIIKFLRAFFFFSLFFLILVEVKFDGAEISSYLCAFKICVDKMPI